MNINNGDEIGLIIANGKFYYVDGAGQYKLLGYQIPQTDGEDGQVLAYDSGTDKMIWADNGGGASISTATQDTSVTTDVTCNGSYGVITLFNGGTLGSGASNGFTLNNSSITSGSIVLLSLQNSAGRSPICFIDSPSDGSVVIRRTNPFAVSVSAGVKLFFQVINE